MVNIDARAEEIKNMILKMGAGNFSYRIPRSADNTETESIIALLNMLAQEFEVAYNPLFGIPPTTMITRVQHYFFILDDQNGVLQTNCNVDTDSPLEKQNFLNILSSTSQAAFKKLVKTLKKKDKTLHTQLEVLSDKKLVLPLNCSVVQIEGSHPAAKFLVMLSHIQTLNPLLIGKLPVKREYPMLKLKILKSSQDIKKFRDIEVYIRKHSNEPLVSLKDIASKFNINEYKLKKGFKELYQTSVFKYHLRSRLTHALQLIINTTDRLSAISQKTGFKNYVHFAQAFKKEFGVSPSHHRKQK